MNTFTVVAGKLEVYEGQIERNYKVISEPFNTLIEADNYMTSQCSGYPWQEIEYFCNGTTYILKTLNYNTLEEALVNRKVKTQTI